MTRPNYLANAQADIGEVLWAQEMGKYAQKTSILRLIEGVEPDAVQVASPVLNGGLRHEVVSVMVVLDMTSRHHPLSHQRYPTKMCRKVTTCTEPSDHEPPVARLASQP
jgi:hypothetical protein